MKIISIHAEDAPRIMRVDGVMTVHVGHFTMTTQSAYGIKRRLPFDVEVTMPDLAGGSFEGIDLRPRVVTSEPNGITVHPLYFGRNRAPTEDRNRYRNPDDVLRLPIGCSYLRPGSFMAMEDAELPRWIEVCGMGDYREIRIGEIRTVERAGGMRERVRRWTIDTHPRFIRDRPNFEDRVRADVPNLDDAMEVVIAQRPRVRLEAPSQMRDGFFLALVNDQRLQLPPRLRSALQVQVQVERNQGQGYKYHKLSDFVLESVTTHPRRWVRFAADYGFPEIGVYLSLIDLLQCMSKNKPISGKLIRGNDDPVALIRDHIPFVESLVVAERHTPNPRPQLLALPSWLSQFAGDKSRTTPHHVGTIFPSWNECTVWEAHQVLTALALLDIDPGVTVDVATALRHPGNPDTRGMRNAVVAIRELEHLIVPDNAGWAPVPASDPQHLVDLLDCWRETLHRAGRSDDSLRPSTELMNHTRRVLDEITKCFELDYLARPSPSSSVMVAETALC